MAIERTIDTGGSGEVDLLNQDMDQVFQQLNLGIDPAQIPQSGITADKLRTSHPGTGSTGYALGPGGTNTQIPAGGIGFINLGVLGNVSGIGVGSGTYYTITPYLDFFMDPSGASGLPINSIYTNTTLPDSGGKIITSFYLRNSTSSSSPTQLFYLTAQAHNTDTVAHWVYATVMFNVINTQASTPQ